MDERPTVGLIGRAPGERRGTRSTRRSGASRMRCARSATPSRRSGCRGARAGSANASWITAGLRPGGCLRLDERLVHARPARGDRERRLPGRALLHVLRRDRLLPADQDGRLGGPPPAVDDDPPSRGQGAASSRASRASALTHGSSTRASTSPRPTARCTSAPCCCGLRCARCTGDPASAADRSRPPTAESSRRFSAGCPCPTDRRAASRPHRPDQRQLRPRARNGR